MFHGILKAYEAINKKKSFYIIQWDGDLIYATALFYFLKKKK